MELRSHGPSFMLDAAFGALRAGGAGLAGRAVLGALPLCLCVLALDYFEQVEGVRVLRAPLSVAIVLTFLGRSVVLSRVSRAYALLLRPSLPVVEPAPRPVRVASTAVLVGFGLLVWLAPLLAIGLAAPLALVVLWPFTALRGAVAPSWLARASCGREHGGAAYGQALDDAAGMRGALLIVELLVQFGALALLGNLFALVGILLALGHAMLGLDVAFVSAFTTPDNPWTLLLLACATLLALEPLRAAVSAQAFVEARTRRDGADLHEAVDAAIESGRARARGAGVASVALLVAATWCVPAEVHAQRQAEVTPSTSSPAPAPAINPSVQDGPVRARVARILARDEFREHAGADGALSRWFARLGAWLETLELEQSDREQSSFDRGVGGELGTWGFMALVVVALGLLAWLMRARSRRHAPASAGADTALGVDGGTAGAGATELGAEGDPRFALRALYLATLAALDRAGRLELDPSKTNGQHLRALPRGPSRRALAELTRTFDRAWYGRQSATAEDVARCRALAARVLATEPSETPNGGVDVDAGVEPSP